MPRVALFGLVAWLSLICGSMDQVRAAATTGDHFVTLSDGTGPLSFTISPHSGFSSDVVELGSQSDTIRDVAFNPALGVLIGGVATLTFGGDPFKVVYSVEGFGNEMVYSDEVTVTAKAILNGSTILGTPEVFHVSLSDSCGGPDQPDVDRFCSTKQLLDAFSGSQSIVLPPHTSANQVQFVYQVTQSDEHCIENYYTDGEITTTSACTMGGTSVFDTSDLADPSWSGDVSVTYEYRAPEPATLGLLGIGTLFIVAGRRARRG